MSTNLTISYTSLSAPGTTPAGVAGADAPAGDSPLGFLAALIDQLLAGGSEPASGTDTSDIMGMPGLTGLPFGNEAAPPPATTPAAPDLIAGLTSQLDALRAQLARGESPAPAQLQQLSDTADALTTAIAAPTLPAARPDADATDEQIAQLLASLGAAAPGAGNVQPVADAREKLLALGQSLAATAPLLAQKLEALAGRLADVEASPELLAQLTGQPPADDTPTISAIIRTLLGETPAQPAIGDAPDKLDSRTTASTSVADELLQLLATLGLTPSPSVANANSDTPPEATSPATTAVSPAVLRLSNQLSQLGSTLADSAPELAQKLEAVATKLVSGGADPQLFAQLTNAAADPDGAALDKLVQSLLDPKPVTPPAQSTPHIAAPADLDIPAPLAPQESKSAVTEVKAAQPQPAPVTADSAPEPIPRLAVTETKPDAAPKPEPKLTDVVAETAKADPAAAPSTQAQAGTAPIIPGATARALPAAYQPVANPINMGQMAFEMVRQVHQGNSRFTLRLDPPELGRVDVRMHVDNQGAVTARLTVERAETLDLFQRDQRSLERALAQAGLDSSKTSLEFSLRQNPFGQSGGDPRQQQQTFANAPRFSPGGDNDNAAMPAVTLYRGIASAGGVNIFA